jgi:DNA invertase Pin-like site-specific DNA recombinase
MRLSKEDEFCHEESNSISMQRLMLRDYVREHFPDAKVTEYADDGYSGTNFERPGVQELLEEVKNGMINCIVVKDFSRFGRDYIELGSYLEQIFPFMGVRFISVNDKYDSDSFSGNVADIDVNFKNLLYDLYSRDLSVKVKASLRSIREQGNFIGTEPPFGYVKDPDDRHKLIIAEDEAEIVRRMFSMYADGMSSVEIARTFNAEGVKTPSQIHAEKGLRHFKPKGDVYLWQHTSILRMLKNRDYIGDLVQGTTTCTKIRGGKKLAEKEDLIITENHHEAIIDRELFDKVQARFSDKKTPWKKKDKHVLVGRVKCGCCGRTLRHVGKNQGQPYYWCSGLNINHLDGCVKRIEDFFLEEIVLYQLQQHIMELGDSDRLLQEEKDRALAEVEMFRTECRMAEKAIADAKKKRMAAFEDYALGKSGSYDGFTDQMEALRKKYEDARVRLSEAEGKAAEYGRRKVHESFAVMKLTPELLDEYVGSIEVHLGDDVRIAWK